jgi:hypothetical protein
MKRERRFEWWGKTMLLGAGSALAVGLGGGMLSPALAQTGSAVSASLPTACPDQEALVSDEVDGPGSPGRGEVIRFTTSRITPTGARSVLSSNAVGTGPALGNTERVRVLNGVIYLLDGTSVLSVDALNGNRTLISGAPAAMARRSSCRRARPPMSPARASWCWTRNTPARAR